MSRGIGRLSSLFIVVGLALLVVVARNKGTSSKGSALSIAPATSHQDPGPTQVIGSDAEPNGTQFLAADVYVEGESACRVYFDRRDNQNFHYMDRNGQEVSIGLCEAGLEQILATGKITAGPLRLARHGAHIAVFQANKLILSAFDDRVVGGSIGHRTLSGAPVNVRVEQRDDVHFADDFMNVDAKAGQWRGNGSPDKGDFLVRSLRHPLLSANAFNYMGAGKNIHSVTGQPWWDQYRYEVSLRGPASGAIGLVFAYYDDKNYGLFRWTSRKSGESGEDPGKRQLLRVQNGEEVLLCEAPGGYAPDQWYAAQLTMSYSSVRIAIDKHLLLEASDPFLAAGGAGVWCDVPLPTNVALDPRAQAFQYNSLNELMQQHAVFDDVRVNTLEGFEDNFQIAGPLRGGWLVGTGDWTVRPATVPAQKSDRPTRPAKQARGELAVNPGQRVTKALIGDRRWAQYELEADVKPGSGSAGLVFLHRDESNYYYAAVDQKQLRLVSVCDGKEETVDSVALKNTDAMVRLKTKIQHGHINVTADKSVSVEWFAGDASLTGRAGFIAGTAREAGAPSIFGNFNLSFLPEAEPLVTTNAIFEDELTMSDWTSPSSEWYSPAKEQLMVEGKPVTLLWHRGQFPGDVTLMVELREVTDAHHEVALSVAKDGQGKNNGYVFRYKAGDSADGGSKSATLQLIRQGELKIERPLSDDIRQLSSIALRRCGKYIVGIINGRPVISYRDEQPLQGNKVAYYTQGVAVRSEATKIMSDHFRNDQFSSAPVTWRAAGNAIAEVTNRWQCDPRWSFFSLKNDMKKGKPAVLWSKNLYSGDVTVEFYVGNKMEGERGQPYTYARDINVSICSDGSDLTKGYTFMFGGHNNAGSMIMRNGEVVKRIDRSIPTDMNYHRHWFAIKIEKQGNRLAFRVDRFFADDRNKTSDLVFEDSVPLTGDHVAIWTYNHAIMISRVRISGDGGDVVEDPDWIAEPLKTPYDGK